MTCHMYFYFTVKKSPLRALQTPEFASYSSLMLSQFFSSLSLIIAFFFNLSSERAGHMYTGKYQNYYSSKKNLMLHKL